MRMWGTMGAHGGHVWWASDVWRRLQAKPLYEEALAAFRETLGDRHPNTLTSINNLGSLLKDQGRLDEARSPPCAGPHVHAVRVPGSDVL